MVGDALVTIVIPARNMEPYIEACLRSIAAQSYPIDRMEVLVVDGDSSDDTRRIAMETLSGLGLKGGVLGSPKGTIPANLNVGLANATGDFLCRVDAKSLIPPDYVERCVDLLRNDPTISVVGGVPVAVAARNDAVGRGIARAVNNRWGMGFSSYRTRGTSGESDTVYLGAFRVDRLRLSGGWDERMHANQDFELNRRMSRTGKVWFDKDLQVSYIPRSTIRSLFQRHRRFGRYKVKYWRLSGEGPRPRQWALLLCPPLVLLAGAAWCFRRNALRRFITLCMLGAGGTLLIEAVGCDEPDGEPEAHLVAAASLHAAGSAWLLGVVEELICNDGAQ